ncbi:Troponin I [Schistosoma japonicum]|nr:Troponin I [Schistosoma japonicum]
MSDEESQQSSSEEETEKEKREKEERKRREEEVAQERQRKLEEKKRKEAEEASKKQRKPGQKRKGLGGLSKEKKRLLKQLIMQKAADEMKAEMKRRQEERENFLRGKVEPLKLDGLGENDLNAKVKQLYERVRQLEGDKYDWEEKLRRQDFEVMSLPFIFNKIIWLYVISSVFCMCVLPRLFVHFSVNSVTV